MKRFSILVLTCFIFSLGMMSCGPKCKKCHMDIMGVKSPVQEMCGDQLEQAQKTIGMVCE